MYFSLPTSLQLEITDKCNLKCPHCFNYDTCSYQKNDSKDLKFFEMDKIAQIIVEDKMFSVVLTGGEPLTKPDLLFRLLSYFKNNDISTSINTNLLLLNQSIVDKLLKLEAGGLLVSCPSSDPKMYNKMTGGGDYSIFKRKLKLLVNSGLSFSVNMVVNKNNINQIKTTAIELKEMGIKSFGATPMGLVPGNSQYKNVLDQAEIISLVNDLLWIKHELSLHVDIFTSLPKCSFPEEIYGKKLSFLNRSCQAGKSAITVSNNGDIRPCSHSSEVYGNILEEPFKDIYAKMENWRALKNIPDECSKCKVLSKCLGGCRVAAKATFGDCKSKDIWMGKPFINNPFFQDQSDMKKINYDAVIALSGKFKFRKEEKAYLVCAGNRTTSLVNEELFEFLTYLNKKGKIKVKHLADDISINVKDDNFNRILELLLHKKIIATKMYSTNSRTGSIASA
ncbi:MAG: radical SAM protein [Planctomycetes bacterium]|nr:radical SAM protein [Planctomycetota bacterium]